MLAVTVRVPILSQYGRPGSKAASSIHSRCAANWSATSGGSSTAAMMSPRLISISSRKVSVTAWPARALFTSPLASSTDATCVRRPDGTTTTASPTRTCPAAMVPA